MHEATGLGPLRTRLQRSAGRGLTRFVGRQREIDAMKHAAETGQSWPRAKLAAGKSSPRWPRPGSASRAYSLSSRQFRNRAWLVLETFSVSHGKASAYFPVIELLRNYFKITSDDNERTRREK